MDGSTPMEKTADKTDDQQDHADAKAAAGQNADDGQAGLSRIEDRQHTGDHGNEPGTDCSEDLQNRIDNAGAGQHKRIKKHKNTTFQNKIVNYNHGSAKPR